MRGKAANTYKIENAIYDILAERNPMTVRQAYYQLVSKMIIPNNAAQYQKISGIIVAMRQNGVIPWGWIEDRNRRPRIVPGWNSLQDFGQMICNAYSRNVWKTQNVLVELWLEKDALSGIFQDVSQPYGVTLNVGRGYDGWSSIHTAAERYKEFGKDVAILYFGDFDPSGEDMYRSLKERLEYFDCYPAMIKCAITLEDIQAYNLPHDFAKKSDVRTEAFVKQWGNNCVELDALPVDVLESRIKQYIESFMNMDSLAELRKLEQAERLRLVELIKALN